MQPGQIDLSLQSIQKKIVDKQFDQALNDLREFREAAPDNTEALYMSAVCHRYLSDYDQALASLSQLKAMVPEHGRAHQEEGHTYRAMGHADDALRAYSRACRTQHCRQAQNPRPEIPTNGGS